jgi:hypothetical protein
MEVKSSKAQSTPNEAHSPDPVDQLSLLVQLSPAVEQKRFAEWPRRIAPRSWRKNKDRLQGIVIPQLFVGYALGSRWVGKDGHSR